MTKNLILDIYNSSKTVFSIRDISLLWRESNIGIVKERLHRYSKAGKLYSIRRGFYSKDENYNRFELANKIYTPSYISFETVLGQAGINFQYYGQIFVASYLNREIKVDEQIYSYKKIKDPILTSGLGVKLENNYYIATPERAFLDVIYLNPNYQFDNLSTINWEKVLEILPIYSNKRMEREVKHLGGL